MGFGGTNGAAPTLLGRGRNLRNAIRAEVREVGRNRAPFAPRPLAFCRGRWRRAGGRNLCSGAVSTRVSFTGICLFHSGDPALSIPPLPKSYSGMGATGPFSPRVTRVRVPAAHALRPGPTPAAPPATPAGEALAGARIWGCLSFPPTHREHPPEQSTKRRGLAGTATANPRARVERGREPGMAVSCQAAPTPCPRHSGGSQGGLRTPKLDSRAGRR